MCDKDAIFVKSSFVQIIKYERQIIIWHSLFGKPKKISDDTLKLLNIFSKPQKLNEFYKNHNLDLDGRKVFKEMINDHFFINPGFDERELLNKRRKELAELIRNKSLISNLSLIVSEKCNFSCVYCIHSNNLESSERVIGKIMNFEIAKKAVDYYLNILRLHDKKTAKINFGGGEPLLNWKVIEKTILYCLYNFGQEFDFNFSINTNASLINRVIAEKMRIFNVKIASSLDGLEVGNNKVRIIKGGRKTFHLIQKGFEFLKRADYPIDGIAATINGDNFSDLNESLIDWSLNREMSDVRIDVDVLGLANIQIKDVVDKLMHLREYAFKRNIEVYGFWSRPAENLNFSVLDEHIAFCGAAKGSSLCVNPSGDFYGCGYSSVKMGDLNETLEQFCDNNGTYGRFVLDHTVGSIKECFGCMIEGQCMGGCNITREFAVRNDNSGLKRMCELYRAMTQKLIFEN